MIKYINDRIKITSLKMFAFLMMLFLILPNFFSVFFTILNIKIPSYFFATILSSIIISILFLSRFSSSYVIYLRLSKLKVSYLVFTIVVCFSYFYSASKIDANDKLIFIVYNTFIPIIIFEVFFLLGGKGISTDYFFNRYILGISYFLIFFSFISFFVGYREPFADGVRWTLKGISNPIWFARFIGTLLLIIVTCEKKKLSFLFIFSILAAIPLIYLSGSRGPLISALLVFFVKAVNSVSRIKLIAYVAIFSIFIFLGFTFIGGRLFTSDLFSINERINFLSYFSLDNFPLLHGYGLGSFGIIVFGEDGLLVYPHNIFLELFFETGLLGLFSFFLLLFYFFRQFSTSLLYLLSLYFLLNSQISGDLSSNNSLFILIYLLSNERKDIISYSS